MAEKASSRKAPTDIPAEIVSRNNNIYDRVRITSRNVRSQIACIRVKYSSQKKKTIHRR